jgi:hypothetical protein
VVNIWVTLSHVFYFLYVSMPVWQREMSSLWPMQTLYRDISNCWIPRISTNTHCNCLVAVSIQVVMGKIILLKKILTRWFTKFTLLTLFWAYMLKFGTHILQFKEFQYQNNKYYWEAKKVYRLVWLLILYNACYHWHLTVTC